MADSHAVDALRQHRLTTIIQRGVHGGPRHGPDATLRSELLQHVLHGVIDPSFTISHRLQLDEAPKAYKWFNDKEHGCTKVVMSPVPA